jgi:hypothetical protein
MIDRQQVLKEMKSIEGYFLRNIATHALFQPEFECARTINAILEQHEGLTVTVAEEILSIYNKTNAAQHYAGSGWFDYQLHLIHILNLHNIPLEMNHRTGQISLKSV